MKTYIALLPGFIALFYLYIQFMNGAKTPIAKTFLIIYVPTMLLLPHESAAEIHLFHYNFWQCALIPIVIAYLFITEKKFLPTQGGIKLLDLLVLAYILVCTLSEFYNGSGSAEGGSYFEQNPWGATFSRGILNIFFPYYLSRKLIHPSGLTQKFGKVLVICTLISLIISAYEWRMVANLHVQLVEYLFPAQNETPWTPLYRYDFIRISGPYGHPILFGIGIAVALLFGHWLMQNKFWKNNFSFLPINSFLKGLAIEILLFIGLILTFSRGPLYSFILSLFILSLGYVRRRVLFTIAIVSFYSIVAFIGLQITEEYTNLDRKKATSELQNTAIYRANLMEAYTSYFEEKPWLGWGAMDTPKPADMPSIDNNYIFILIVNGSIALATFCSILTVAGIKLFWTGMKIPYKFRMNQSLAFMLLSILFMLSTVYLTVSMSGQVEVLTFMIVGLSQGFLDTSPTKQSYDELKTYA